MLADGRGGVGVWLPSAVVEKRLTAPSEAPAKVSTPRCLEARGRLYSRVLLNEVRERDLGGRRDVITERVASVFRDLPTGKEGNHVADRPYLIARNPLTVVGGVPEMARRFLRHNPHFVIAGHDFFFSDSCACCDGGCTFPRLLHDRLRTGIPGRVRSGASRDFRITAPVGQIALAGGRSTGEIVKSALIVRIAS